MKQSSIEKERKKEENRKMWKGNKEQEVRLWQIKLRQLRY